MRNAYTPGVAGSALHLVRVANRPERTIEPQRASEATRAGGRARHRQPLFVDLVRLRRVDEDVAVSIVGPGFLERDALVPAVHAAHGIGLYGEGEILVDADFAPPDARAVGIVALER